MAAVLAGEAAVRIVPTLKGFHNRVDTELKRQPHSIEVKVDPNTTRASIEMAKWRKLQESNALNIPVRTKTDFAGLKRDLTQVEHIFKTSSLSKAIRLNIKVIGLDALPALAYAAGSAASGLDALGKSAFVLPGLVGGALASVAALATGLHGVRDALKAYGQDASNSADNARKAQRADRDLLNAKRDLVSAIRDQKREIQDLNSELRRSSLNEADALLSVQESVNRLREGGFKNITEFQRAQLGLLQSVDHLNEVRKQTSRTAEDAAQANADGISQSNRVVDALDRVATATEKQNASKITEVGTALAKLSPNARTAVEAIHSLQGEWTNLQSSVQDNLFADLDKSITDLGRKGLPVLQNGLSGVAQGLNSNIKAIAGSLGSDKNLGFFDRIFGNTKGGLENLSRGIDPLINGFLRLTQVSSNFLPRLGDAASRVFTRFETFINKISDDGSLERWIDQGLDAITSLGNAAGNVLSIVDSVAEAFNAASGTSGGFIGSLERGTQKLADFLKSPQGQNTLVSYFERAKEFVGGIIDALRNIKDFLGDVVDTAREWSSGFLSVVGALTEVASWVERNTGLIKPLILAYLSLKTLKPIWEGLTGAAKGYDKTVRALANFDPTSKYFTPAAGGATKLKEEFKKLGNEAGAAGGKIGGLGAGSLGGSLKNLGAFIGPGLAFTGAIIGLTALVNKLGEAHAAAALDADKQKASLDGLKGSLDSVTGATTQKSLNDNARSLQGYDIPGLGNRNVGSDSARAGLGSPEQILAATIPSQQGTRNDILAKADAQTQAKIGQSDAWKRFQGQWQKYGVDLTTLAKAANGDPAAKATVDKAMSQILNDQNIPSFLPDSAKQTLIASKRSAGLIPDDLTGTIKSAGAYDSASTGIFIRDRSQAAVNEGNLIRGASDLANGRGNLNDAGKALFGPDGQVTIDPNGNAVIQTSREPHIPPEAGNVTKTAYGWQVELTGQGTGQYVQKFATGGLVRGKGSGTSDSNTAMLSKGEWVTKKKAVDHYGQTFFDDLNSMRLPKFGVGGGVGLKPLPPPPPPRPAPPPITPGGISSFIATQRPALPSVSGIVAAPGAAQPGGLTNLGRGFGEYGRIIGNAGSWFNQNLAGSDPNFKTNDLSIPTRRTGVQFPRSTLDKLHDTQLSPGNPVLPEFRKSLTPGGFRPATPKPPTPAVNTSGTPHLPSGSPSAAGPHHGAATPGQPTFPGPSTAGIFSPGNTNPALNNPAAPLPVTPAPSANAPSAPVPNEPIYSVAPTVAGPQISVSGPTIQRMNDFAGLADQLPYLWGGFGPNGMDCCLTGETLVYGPNGARYISELKTGDVVYSFEDGKLTEHRVNAAWFSKHQETFRVHTRNRNIDGSANHPFLRLYRSETYSHKGKPRSAKSGYDTWDTEWVRLDELRRGDLVVQPRSLELRSNPANALPSGRILSLREAWLLGLIIGDGTVKDKCVEICVYEHMRDTATAIAINMGAVSGTYSDSVGVRLYSTALARELAEAGLHWRGSDKRVPECVWGWDDRHIRAFLDGYADADGYFPQDDERYGQRSYSSCSPRLIDEIRALHIYVGDQVSNVTVNQRKHPIVIKGKRVKRALNLHTFTVNNHVRNTGGNLPNGVKVWQDENPEFIAARILSVSPLGAQDTYDIEVEGSHNFIADGFVVHNSGLALAFANIATGQDPFAGGRNATAAGQSGFSTANEGAELLARGFQAGPGGPGTLTIGWSPTHTGITLPDGRHIDAQGDAAGIVLGDGSQGATGFPNVMHLPLPDVSSLPGLPGVTPALPDSPDVTSTLTQLGVDPSILNGGQSSGQLDIGQRIAGAYENALKPENIKTFLDGEFGNIGQGLSSAATSLLGGLTGLDLSSLTGAGTDLANNFLGGDNGGQSGASGINDAAGQNLLNNISGLPGTSLGGSGGGANAPTDPTKNAVYKAMLAAGFPESEWPALEKLIQGESSWRPGNTNSSSGAFGLFQFLGHENDKYGQLGGYSSDAASQAVAGMAYIKDQYGSPSAALKFWESQTPHYYAKGGPIKGKGGPRTDSILARVSHGEFLNKAASVSHYGPELFAGLNAMTIPKSSLPGFEGGGGIGIPFVPPPIIPPPPAPPPPPPTPAPAATAAAPAGGQSAGPLPQASPTPTVGAPGVPASSVPSTGGAPGPGATAPAPETSPLPQVENALSGIGGLLAGSGVGSSASGIAQPGADPSNQGDNRGTLGAAPASGEHTNPALKGGIEQGAAHIGQLLATAVSAAGGAAGAAAPGAGAASAAAGAAIQAGAQIAGKVASGAVNILSSLAVGTLTGGSTAQASGVPLLPQRQPMQTGVPPVQQDNRQYHVANLDEFARLQQRHDAQQQLPYLSKW